MISYAYAEAVVKVARQREMTAISILICQECFFEEGPALYQKCVLHEILYWHRNGIHLSKSVIRNIGA